MLHGYRSDEIEKYGLDCRGRRPRSVGRCGRSSQEKLVEDMIKYDLEEPSSDHFFLVGSNLKENQAQRHLDRQHQGFCVDTI